MLQFIRNKQKITNNTLEMIGNEYQIIRVKYDKLL